MALRKLATVLLVPALAGPLLTLPAGSAVADPPGTVEIPSATMPLTLSLGPGRAYASTWWTSPGMPAYRFPMSKAGNVVTVGSGTFVDYFEEGLRLSVSSNRVFYDSGVLRYEGSSSVTSAGPNRNRVVRLSGNRALFVQKVGANEWPAHYNIKTGATVAPFGTGVDRKYPTDLWGEYLAYALPNGAVYRRDLRTGTVTLVRSPGSKILAVGVYAGRVAWLTACPPAAPCNQTLSWRTVGSATVFSTAVVDAHGLRLGGGKVVLDRLSGSRQVVAIDLASKAVQVVGTLDQADPWTYDLYDETVGWIQGATGKLAPLPAHTESPRFLGNAIGPASFNPPALWRGAFPLSKPLTDCRVTFRKNGTPVRIIGCAASTTTGLATVAWDGKTGSGNPVSNGTYTWTLTGSDADGSLRWYTGSAGAISGTVTVV